MPPAVVALLASPLLIGASPLASLEVAVDGLRSDRGQLRLCLTADPGHFPDCHGDPKARRLTVPVAAADTLRFDGLAAGGYAISLIHDENGNGSLDTRLGIPREGFGFSRNPVVMFGPPRFAAARFRVATPDEHQSVRVKYLL